MNKIQLHLDLLRKKQERRDNLKLRFSGAGLWVTQEGDERGPEGVLFVVVLGAFTVGQLDQPVVVRQPRVCFPKAPRTKTAGTNIPLTAELTWKHSQNCDS